MQMNEVSLIDSFQHCLKFSLILSLNRLHAVFQLKFQYTAKTHALDIRNSSTIYMK